MTKNEQKLSFIYSTFPNREEALSVARKLLETKLIACANIIDSVTSLYHWEGKLCEENEVILIAKTNINQGLEALEALIKLHSYDIPCAVLIPPVEAHPAFARWVNDQLPNS